VGPGNGEQSGICVIHVLVLCRVDGVVDTI